MSRKFMLIVASAILGCGAQKPANPNAGQVKISTGANAHLATNDGTAPNVCGTFTLQPYSLDANGNQTLAGNPQTISSVPGSQTDAILGCIAGTGDATGQNWGYIVSATGFIDCSGVATDPYNGIAIPGLSPSTVTGNYPVICKAGVDTSLAINVDVSIPEANGAGYIDISVGVDSTEVQAGCKQADIDSSGLLHFGQSYVQTTTGVTPSAYTGIGIYTGGSTGTAPASGSVQQFEGSVQSGAENDAYFTGLFQLPDSSSSTTLVQAFAQPCAAGQMTLQPNAVQCVTQATLPDSTTTAVQISDVFVQWPGHGAVSASITDPLTITLYTSLGGPNLGTLSTGTMGYDALTSTQALTLSDTAIGLYGSLVALDQLNALVQDATLGPSLVVLTLDESTGQWSAALPVALSTLSLAQQQAIGLFGAGGCFAEPGPSQDAPADLAYDPGTLACGVGQGCELGAPTSDGGSVTSYSISPSLPNGLNFDPSTGAISGTATAASTNTTYTVTATNSAGSTTTTITISVAAAPPANSVGNLNAGRDFSTATLLNDGRVLIAGGSTFGNQGGDALATAELFDPTTGTFTLTGSLNHARCQHTATLLPNGQVLIVGTNNGTSVAIPNELFDPSTGAFTDTAFLLTARSAQTATLMPNGLVLIVGGDGPNGQLTSAELYDPSNGHETLTGSLNTARSLHTATMLPNGLVLIAGGRAPQVDEGLKPPPPNELYNPSTGIFTNSGLMVTERMFHTATLLQNGLVLMAGGLDQNENPTALLSAELYDPSNGTSTATGDLLLGLELGTATLLPSGLVLFAGGDIDDYTAAHPFQLYDPVAGSFASTGLPANARIEHVAALLQDGHVLIAGGSISTGSSFILSNNAVVY